LDNLRVQAEVFASFGYTTAIIERRGFGSSSEPFAENVGPCPHRDYQKSIAATNSDLQAAIEYFFDKIKY